MFLAAVNYLLIVFENDQREWPPMNIKPIFIEDLFRNVQVQTSLLQIIRCCLLTVIDPIVFLIRLSGLIVDEAHQMGQIAIRHNEIVFSYTNWKYIMGQVGSEAEGQLLHGIFSLSDRFEFVNRSAKDGLLNSFAQICRSI